MSNLNYNHTYNFKITWYKIYTIDLKKKNYFPMLDTGH